MKSFKEHLQESGRIVRFDSMDRQPSTAEYAFSPDKQSSGRVTPEWNIPSDWSKERGIFAGTIRHASPYSVPRSVRWITRGERRGKVKPTIYFDRADRKNIKSHVSRMTTYNKRQGFESTAGEEVFHKGIEPPRPVSTQEIRNPLKFLKKNYKVKFVPNLNWTKQKFVSGDIKHSSEGSFS